MLKKENLLKSKDLPPVLLLYGADAFSIDEMLDGVLKKVILTEEDKIDFDSLDAEEVSANSVVSVADQMPMMASKRVVVVRRFNKYFADRRKKSDTTNSLIKYLQNPNNTTLLILLANSETKIDFTKLPYNLLKDYAVEFPTIYENQLPKWVSNRFSAAGVSITPDATELIVSQTEPNLRNLANEVEKILLYHIGKKSLNAGDVAAVSGCSRQNTVFELIKSVAKRDINKSIAIMSNILETSSQEVLMVTLLRDFFVKLWKLVELEKQGLQREELARAIGLRSSYFLSDYTTAARFYSLEDINNAFIILVDTDSKLKSTNSNSTLIIETMLLNICSNCNG